MRFFVLLLPLPRICARQANFAFWEVKLRLKRTFRNDSIEDLYIYYYKVTVIPDCVPEKVAYLK